MEKYVCIHGHFYQPPRENPWLEEIEVQDSAYPYRDWNERISAECYSPNTAARILDAGNLIVNIMNNYSKISFNFGPTLLSWMEVHAPDVYNAVLTADKMGQEQFSGHGTAIAQVYNHMIMPIANRRDKKTQVIWGIEDFRKRFGRNPEGMWLAETAVDTETLEVLAEEGIKFTILAPRQADKIRKIGGKKWSDVSGERVDPRIPYLCKLPSGKSICLFFYDGHISQDLAFGKLLESGDKFADRLIGTIDFHSEQPQLINIATDGETYGHHQNHGDMALTYCLHKIETNEHVGLSIYPEFLEKYPPMFEVKIFDNTSWSCAHGIERWRSDCGCNAGHPGWNQQWRQPLLNSLNWLRDRLAGIFEREMQPFNIDCWDLRDKYIKVILDRNRENIDEFLSSIGIKDLDDEKRVRILKLLEMQRHAMLMYTSCGWFFDEISGIETVQVIQYAARSVQLLKEVTGEDLEEEFMKLLEQAPGNIPQVPNGARVYESYVKPAKIDLYRVTAHYAVASLFEDEAEKSEIFSFEVKSDDIKFYEAGKQKIVIGKIRLRSKITFEEKDFSFAFLHLGDHNVNGGVIDGLNDEDFNRIREELKNAFQKLNISEIILLIDKYFGSHSYNIWHLFKDKSRSIFNKLLKNTIKDFEEFSRKIYEGHYPVLSAMREAGIPVPRPVYNSVEFIINTEIKRIYQSLDTINTEALQNLFNEAAKWSIQLDKETLGYVGGKRIISLVEIFESNPKDLDLMKEIEISLKSLVYFSIGLNVWKAQNILFMLGKEHLPEMKRKAESGDREAAQWLEHFNNIEKYLQIKVFPDAIPEFDIQTSAKSFI